MNNIAPIGVSGGIDSMSLLHYLHNHTDYQPYVLHFHHGDSHSELACELVKKYCAQHRIPFKIGYMVNNENTSEDYWRKERYKFFDKSMKDLKKSFLFLAHHYTDQEVSYITNFLKGSQRGFIPPISPRDGYAIHRPLHLTHKREIKEYLERHNIPYIEDPTNSESQRGKIEEKMKELKSIIFQMEGAIANSYKKYLIKQGALNSYSISMKKL